MPCGEAVAVLGVAAASWGRGEISPTKAMASGSSGWRAEDCVGRRRGNRPVRLLALCIACDMERKS